MDYDVIKALSSRDSYERYARFIKKSSLNKEAFTIFLAMGEWFKNNPMKAELDWRSFSAWFTMVRYAKLSDDQAALYKGLLAMLTDREFTLELDSLMEGLTKRDHFARIGEVALRGADGDYSATMDGIQALLDEYKEAAGKLDSLERDIGDFSLDRLEHAFDGGLQWRLRCLRQSLGPIRKGDLGLFVARPDTGKTTWLASEATHMAEQLGKEQRVLWINTSPLVA